MATRGQSWPAHLLRRAGGLSQCPYLSRRAPGPQTRHGERASRHPSRWRTCWRSRPRLRCGQRWWSCQPACCRPAECHAPGSRAPSMHCQFELRLVLRVWRCTHAGWPHTHTQKKENVLLWFSQSYANLLTPPECPNRLSAEEIAGWMTWFRMYLYRNKQVNTLLLRIIIMRCETKHW